MPRKDYQYAYKNLAKDFVKLKEQIKVLFTDKSSDVYKEIFDLNLPQDVLSLKNFWDHVSALDDVLKKYEPTDSVKIEELVVNKMLGRLSQDVEGFLRGSSYDLVIIAIKEKNENLIECILGKVPSVIYFTDDDGWYPIHHCAAKGDEKIMEFFLQQDRDMINSRTEYLYTPLHIALQKGNVECIHFLVEHGADQSLTDRGGEGVIDFLKESFPNTASVIGRFSDLEDPILEYNDGHLDLSALGNPTKYSIDKFIETDE